MRFAAPERTGVARLASALNAEFAALVSHGPLGVDESIDWESPLWYRPSERTPSALGVLQIAGHTPLEMLRGDDSARMWASRGLYLIDPFVRRWVRLRESRLPAPLRYAVIDDGAVTVVEGEGYPPGY